MAEYINREALEADLNIRLTSLRDRNGYYDHYTNGFDECVDRVENFPSANVAEVKHGKWMKEDKGFGRDITTLHLMRVYKYICPLCGYNTDNQASRFNFCPNCGARMNGEE